MDLTHFCCKNPIHLNIHTPFTQGDYTWATTGFLAIGVPVLPDVPENPSAPDMNEPRKAAEASQKGEWFPVPVIDADGDCPHCKGIVVNFNCYECGGLGTVTLKNQYTEYSGIECATCEGEGEAMYCGHCLGTGKDANGLVDIGSGRFRRHALLLLRDLPNVEICPTGTESPAYLRFSGGGIGFLMPAKDLTV
jgi:hypothetical protein